MRVSATPYRTNIKGELIEEPLGYILRRSVIAAFPYTTLGTPSAPIRRNSLDSMTLQHPCLISLLHSRTSRTQFLRGWPATIPLTCPTMRDILRVCCGVFGGRMTPGSSCPTQQAAIKSSTLVTTTSYNITPIGDIVKCVIFATVGGDQPVLVASGSVDPFGAFVSNKLHCVTI